MGKEDLPTYDEHDHGLDADIKDVPLSTSERNARYERYAGVRQALADGQTTSLAAMNEVVNQAIEPKRRASRSALAVVYLRVSTEEQARVGGSAEGYSIPSQRDACYAKAKQLGLTVVGEYVDAGYSAKSANRPELQLLRELRELKVGFVIVHKIDRLARNT